MLEDAELRDVKQAFWKRYCLRFPAEVHPADSLLSRVSRELSKRMLCVFAFWKVCSLYFQLTTVQRKRKLGDNLYTEEIETEGSISKDVETYLDKLYTLLLAYAMAGVHPLPGVDLSKEAEELFSGICGGPPRCRHGVLLSGQEMCLILAPVRLQWLQAKDIEERSEWVTRFREGTAPLTHSKSSSSRLWRHDWVVTRTAVSGGLGEAQATGGTGATATQAALQVSHFREGSKVGGKRVAAVLKDGTKLCPDFQLGKCSNPKCQKGAHKCGVIVRNQRGCGSPGHGREKVK